jgi:cytoskeletal protein CcmA (bactofilin family)
MSVFCPHCQKRAPLESLTITGSHPGKTLMTCGDVLVAATARLHVELFASRVTIHGRVRGPVVANELVEVFPTGQVIGDISAPRLVVHDGAVIEGRCELIRPVPRPAQAGHVTVEEHSGDAAPRGG